MLFIIRESNSVHPAFYFSFIECHKGFESTQHMHDKSLLRYDIHQKPSVKLHVEKYDQREDYTIAVKRMHCTVNSFERTNSFSGVTNERLRLYYY